MREMRRKGECATQEEARRIVEESEYGFLATAGNGGVPYGVPVSHVLHGQAVYFHCAVEGRKLDNIRENPAVCLTCISRAEPLPEQYDVRYACAVVEGRAALVEDEAEVFEALLLIGRHYTQHDEAALDAYIRARLHRTLVCRIDIETITGKIHGGAPSGGSGSTDCHES